MVRTDEIERVVRETAEADPTVVAAWLFGSVARGTAGPASDVDVAVLRDAVAPARTLDDLPLGLEDVLGRRLGRPVQVVELASAPDDLVHRVLRDGVLLVDRDPARRVRFEVRSRARYFDMAPIWRRYRAAGGTG